MSAPGFRRSVAVGIVAALALGLSGCASWGLSQREWAGALEKLPGVESVDWTYRNGWPNSGVTYDSDIALAPDLTEQQARSIAAESCQHNTLITAVSLVTPGPDGREQTGVTAYGAAEGACLPEPTMVLFAQVAAARQAAAEFDGSIDVFSMAEADAAGAAAESPEGLRIEATAGDSTMLVDALRELHEHVTERPFRFAGGLSDQGASLSRSRMPLIAMLSPDADFARLEPLVVQALTIDHQMIIVTDDRVEVQISNTDVVTSPQLSEFHRLADEAGVATVTRFPPLGQVEPVEDEAADQARQTALIDALAAVPGGARVAVPAADSAGAVTVAVNDPAGFESAVQLVAAAPEYTTKFEITAPGPELFWVSMTSGGIPPQQVTDIVSAALAAAKGVDGANRTIVQLSSGSRSLTVVLPKTSDASAEAEARAFLTDLPGGEVFTEIYLDGPNIDSRDRSVRHREVP
ncbi:hypothetical protein [Plantibacter sp. YIM 135347]|uniref:hypothetical protein n=1 Tax=Plantibacter sp. YIM 135347 TaxID=3423919 RepID=UPI003D355DFC